MDQGLRLKHQHDEEIFEEKVIKSRRDKCGGDGLIGDNLE